MPRAAKGKARRAAGLLLVALLAGAGGAEASIPRPEASAELAGWPAPLPDAPALVDLGIEPATPATTTAPPAAAAAGDRFGLFDPGPGAGLFAAGRPSARARLEAETRLRVHDLELPVRIELEPLELAERTGFALFGRPGMRRGSENRWYDPQLGRFITTDPLGYVDGPSLYQYGLNNPINFSDPLGLQTATGDSDEEESCFSSWKAAWNCLVEPFVRLPESAREWDQHLKENTLSRRDPTDTGLDALAEQTRLTGEVAGDAFDAGLRVSDAAGAGGLVRVAFRAGGRVVTKQVARRHLPELRDAGWEVVDDDVAELGARRLPGETPGLSTRGFRPPPGTRAVPEGIPEGWRIRPTEGEGGVWYVDPRNPGNAVRVMPGNPNSPYPNSRVPYVRWQRNGQALDAAGNVVPKKSPEAHIPLEDFRFNPGLFQ
jgi:hypothetical protein